MMLYDATIAPVNSPDTPRVPCSNPLKLAQHVLKEPPITEWHCPCCSTGRDTESESEDTACENHHRTDDEATMLLCEGKGCGAAWHMGCLPKPLDQIPEGDWYCPDCE